MTSKPISLKSLKYLLYRQHRRFYLDYGFRAAARAFGLVFAQKLWNRFTYNQKVSFIQGYNKSIIEVPRLEGEGDDA